MDNKDTAHAALDLEALPSGPLLRELETRIDELATFVRAMQEHEAHGREALKKTLDVMDFMDGRGRELNSLVDVTLDGTVSLDPQGKPMGPAVARSLTKLIDKSEKCDSVDGKLESLVQQRSLEILKENEELRRKLADLKKAAEEAPGVDGAQEPVGEAGPPVAGTDWIESSLITLLRATVDSTSDGLLLVGEEGDVVIYNQRFVEIFRLQDSKPHLGKIEDSLGFLSDRLLRPKDFVRKMLSMNEKVSEETFDILELDDGRVLEAASRPHLIDEEMSGRAWSFRDATDRSRAETALRDLERRHALLIENLDLGTFSCSSTGRALAMDDRVMGIFGVADKDEISNFNLLENSALVRCGIADAVRKVLEAGESICGEFTLKRDPRKIFHGRIHLTPLREAAGDVSSLYGVIQDVSDQKRAEDLVLRSQRLKVLGQMASGVGHTFSNVLQIIQGNANMALTNLELEEFDEVKPNLDQILDSVQSATDAVRRLQQFGRERPGGETSSKVVFDLSSAVVEGVEMCKLWSKGKLEKERIEIVQDLELSQGCHVEGRPDQIAWVVVNLLKNAVEALGEKGGRIKVSTAVKGDYVNLMVQDNGVGIPEEDIRHITTAFWTSKESHEGMGLSVNSRIIREHHGTMGVKRAKPHGTAFSIKLPRAKKPSAKVKETARAVTERKFRILLVDDERPVVTILGKGLKKRGNTPYIALSGEEGLKALQENPVDAIVCDLGMEGMNGWEVSAAVAELCSQKGIRKPPFILLTGWGGQLGEDEILYHPHVDRIAEKPVTIPALLEVIAQEVEKASAVDA